MMTFETWLINLGKSSNTAHKYSKAIEGSISKWAMDGGLTDNKISTTISLTDFESLVKQIQQLDIFISRNTIGKGMYGAALKHFAYFLEDMNGEAIKADIDEILSDNTIAITEKSSLISTRLGQGVFRQKLLNYWGGCAITGYKNTRLLIASHIKPWKVADNNERIDVNNGILLLPNLDKVFDIGYITFEFDGKIRISGELDQASMIGINQHMSIQLTDKHMPYIKYHQSSVFEKFLP
jgi:HNH endonuclease